MTTDNMTPIELGLGEPEEAYEGMPNHPAGEIDEEEIAGLLTEF